MQGVDPLIDIVRQQILRYAEVSGRKDEIRKTVADTDLEKINTAGLWLKKFYETALQNNLGEKELAEMFSALTAPRGKDIKEYVKELTGYSSGKFGMFLKDFDPSSHRIKDAYGMVSYLLKNRLKNLYPEEEFFSAMAKFIATQRIIFSSRAANEVKET